MERTREESNTTLSTTSTTDVTDEGAQALQTTQATPILHLRLEHQPRNDRSVGFHEGVIDNEHMNRKKSKCCCIYRKPLAFGESSSDEDDECEHCFGHPEVKTKNKKKHDNAHSHEHTQENDGGAALVPPTSEQHNDEAASVKIEQPTKQPEIFSNPEVDLTENK